MVIGVVFGSSIGFVTWKYVVGCVVVVGSVMGSVMRLWWSDDVVVVVIVVMRRRVVMMVMMQL